MKFYKIVRKIGEQLFSQNSLLPDDFILEYKVGEKTIPNEGKILVFSMLDSAKAYYARESRCTDINRYEVYECEVENPITITKLGVLSYRQMHRFWLSLGRDMDCFDTFYAPRGTCGVDSCILTRKLTEEELDVL